MDKSHEFSVGTSCQECCLPHVSWEGRNKVPRPQTRVLSRPFLRLNIWLYRFFWRFFPNFSRFFPNISRFFPNISRFFQTFQVSNIGKINLLLTKLSLLSLLSCLIVKNKDNLFFEHKGIIFFWTSKLLKFPIIVSVSFYH